MVSLVDELQFDASNMSVSIANLLRKAWMVANKLGLSDLPNWIKNELEGYENEEAVPNYRIVYGHLMAKNPVHGWIPAQLQTNEFQDMVSRRPMVSPISEVEALLKRDGRLTLGFSPEQLNLLADCFSFETEYRLFLEKAKLEAILDGIRNKVLEWAISLEQSGVKGEGLSFTNAEREKAQRISLHFQGGNIHIGTIGSTEGSTNQAIGNNSRVNITSQDFSTNTVPGLPDNTAILANELEELRKELLLKASGAPQYAAIGEVANAEIAARGDDKPKLAKALANLGSAGQWALGIAEKIGVPLVTAALKSHYNLPDA